MYTPIGDERRGSWGFQEQVPKLGLGNQRKAYFRRKMKRDTEFLSILLI